MFSVSSIGKILALPTSILILNLIGPFMAALFVKAVTQHLGFPEPWTIIYAVFTGVTCYAVGASIITPPLPTLPRGDFSD